MQTRLTTLLCCLIFPLFTQAQTGKKFNIIGTVHEQDEQVLPFAAVSLFQDSTLIVGDATDMDGKFKLQVPNGHYRLEVSFLSFTTQAIELDVESKAVDMGIITLGEDATTVDAIEVTTNRSEMQMDLDKRVFNIAEDVNNAGRNASEILDNIPSVTVDIDGNVSLRGSQSVRILIDGKPSGLTGLRSPDALRLLQGDMIERIEVITNPSARYEAEGEAGIINIVLKKNKKYGINGSFEARAGYPENFGGSVNLNIRQKNVNLFTNLGVNYRRSPGEGFTRLETLDNGEPLIFNSTRNHFRGGLGFNGQLGMNFFIDDFNTITISGLYSQSRGRNGAEIVYEDFDANNELINLSTRTDDEIETKYNTEAAFNYTRKFKKEKHELTFDFKWLRGIDQESANYTQGSQLTTDSLFQRNDNTENEQNFLIQSDYVLPIGKDGKFEAGTRIGLRTINNDYTLQEQDADGTWRILPQFNDNLVYQENIYAVYTMYGNKWKNLSYQAGVRFEYSDITTSLLESGSTNARQYYGFFPSAHLAYEFSKTGSAQLSYSRRLRRPNFWSLVPFYGFSDNRVLWQGNPDLDPEYTQSFDASYMQYFKKGSLLTSIYYRYTTDVQERVTTVLDDGFTQSFPVNIGIRHSLGFEMNATYDATKWWRLMANANLFREETDGVYDNIELYGLTYSWTGRFSTKFTLPKQLNIQATFNYRSPRIRTQGRALAISFWNLGISKEVLNGKGTLTFNVSDLFNTRKRRYITEFDGFYSEGVFQWRARQFMLTFNYRLNQKQGKRGGSGRGDYGEN